MVMMTMIMGMRGTILVATAITRKAISDSKNNEELGDGDENENDNA
jgi:hypothetical protein